TAVLWIWIQSVFLRAGFLWTGLLWPERRILFRAALRLPGQIPWPGLSRLSQIGGKRCASFFSCSCVWDLSGPWMASREAAAVRGADFTAVREVAAAFTQASAAAELAEAATSAGTMDAHTATGADTGSEEDTAGAMDAGTAEVTDTDAASGAAMVGAASVTGAAVSALILAIGRTVITMIRTLIIPTLTIRMVMTPPIIRRTAMALTEAPRITPDRIERPCELTGAATHPFGAADLRATADGTTSARDKSLALLKWLYFVGFKRR